jgi:glycolate oxidase FAD binding subunit
MDKTKEFIDTVTTAAANATPLNITGSGSKRFYGHDTGARNFPVIGHHGITDYSPTEMVISARAGTPLSEIESALESENQQLAFEPPHFGNEATLGGMVACGLSGPARPYRGAVRDFVLGIKCINGKGEVLRFGGKVMKNVAGYDVSRLMTGSLGTLALFLEINLRVTPRPETETTMCLEMNAREAIDTCNRIAGQPCPLSAACFINNRLYLRLSGNAAGIAAALKDIGGEELESSQDFWLSLREQQLPFFTDADTLWRLSLPPTTPALPIDGDWLIDWGGGQRWLKTEVDAADIRDVTARAGGHATRYRGNDPAIVVFQPLASALFKLHQRLKQAFDPRGILNPGRMYPGI